MFHFEFGIERSFSSAHVHRKTAIIKAPECEFFESSQ